MLNAFLRSLRCVRSFYLYLLIGGTLSFFACQENASTSQQPQENYQVIRPKILDTVYTSEYVAKIESIQNIELRSRIRGFIDHILVDEGQAVQDGQTLFSINSQSLRVDVHRTEALLKSAIAEYKLAEVEYTNKKTLVNTNIVSPTELEMSQAKLDAAQARVEQVRTEVEMARLTLSYASVKAPFEGVVNRIPNKQGSLIEEGELLTTLSNNKEFFAYFHVSEKDYLALANTGKISENRRVGLILADGQNYPYEGVVEIAENEIDPNTGNLAFRARFPNAKGILHHGSSGKVQVKTQLKNALLIPQKSTFELQDKLFVFVVDQSQTVHIRQIVAKLRLGQLYVVDSGLTLQDQVVFEGIQRLKEGDKIQVSLSPTNAKNQ
jgi:membrane fusion protein (multidrug efflux system)